MNSFPIFHICTERKEIELLPQTQILLFLYLGNQMVKVFDILNLDYLI